MFMSQKGFEDAFALPLQLTQAWMDMQSQTWSNLPEKHGIMANIMVENIMEPWVKGPQRIAEAMEMMGNLGQSPFTSRTKG